MSAIMKEVHSAICVMSAHKLQSLRQLIAQGTWNKKKFIIAGGADGDGGKG